MAFKFGHIRFRIPLLYLEICMPFKLGHIRFRIPLLHLEICMPFKYGQMSFRIPWVDSPSLNEERLITYKAGSIYKWNRIKKP